MPEVRADEVAADACWLGVGWLGMKSGDAPLHCTKKAAARTMLQIETEALLPFATVIYIISCINTRV